MKQNKYLRLLVIAAMVFSLQSCLKNNSFYTDFSKGKPAVELPLAANFTNEPFAVSFDVSNTPAVYYAVVNVASVNKPTSPVTATLGIDQAYLDKYNADQTALDPDNYVPYELMPDSTYSIPNLNATIAAGHREDSVPIQIFTNKIAPGHIYLLPLTIVKASLPISNWNHLMINIGAKNRYDGEYNLTLSTVGWGAYGIADGGSINWGKIGLVTSGASSVTFDIGYQPAFTSTGGPTGFGATDPQFTFDPSTNNLINVTNLAAPDSRNRAFTIDPSVTDSKFDPSTHNMYLAYIMTQTGRPPQYIKATLTYVGPR